MKIQLLGITTEEEIAKQIRIVAAAGKLSRFPGTATEIYDSSIDCTKNIAYIKRILALRHKSIVEHDFINLIIENVTPIAEQALIESRLCAFTIKSRREVDFRGAGFYTPEFRDLAGNPHKENERLKSTYQRHMQGLFDTYSELIDSGVAKEDARYVFPYCFYSNIIMTLDARELDKQISELLYGELSKITELKELGEKLKEIADKRTPYLEEETSKKKKDSDDHFAFLDEDILGSDTSYSESNANIRKFDGVHITHHTENPDDVIIIALLQKRYQMSREEAVAKYSTMSDKLKQEVMSKLVKSNEKEARALEQANFTMEFPISLANLTHITRHRMHSLMVPRLFPISNLENYIIPPEIEETAPEKYHQAYFDNKAMYDEFVSMGVNPADLVYFYQAGNTINITTTMDARSVAHICELRQCNKAQWEIRGIANAIEKQVEEVAPLLGENLGPTCKTEGMCYEGRTSCGNPYTKQIKGV